MCTKQSFADVIDTAAQEAIINIGEFQRFCDHIGARAAQSGMDEANLAILLDD